MIFNHTGHIFEVLSGIGEALRTKQNPADNDNRKRIYVMNRTQDISPFTTVPPRRFLYYYEQTVP